MRVVIDTNIWVSGLLWGGIPGALIRLAEQGRITLWATATMLQELQEVLERPRLEPRRRELGLEVAEMIAYATALVALIDIPDIPPVVHDDPDDDMIVACATAVHADYLISGDRHLRALRQIGAIPILTPQEFFTLAFPSPEPLTS